MDISKKVLDVLALDIRQKLIESASNGKKLYYSDIAVLGDDRHMSGLSDILSKISRYEHKNGRPLLSAIVVQKENELPDTGFFLLCDSLKTTQSLEKMQLDCFEFWSKEENKLKYMTKIQLTKEEKDVRERLIKLAHDAVVEENNSYVSISYQELYDVYGLNLEMQYPTDISTMSKILDNISTYEYANRGLILSSLVINKTINRPGDGFYKLCEKLVPMSDNWEVLKAKRVDIGMMQKCLEFWQKEENYTKYKNIE